MPVLNANSAETMLPHDTIYAVIAIVVSSLVVSEWLRHLPVRVLTRMMDAIKSVLTDPMLMIDAIRRAFPTAFKFVVCAAVLYGTLPILHPAMVVIMARQGGIQKLVEALNTHPDQALVQQFGCGMLAWKAMTRSNRKEIPKRKGIPAIIKALDYHPGHAGVQKSGCAALQNLAFRRANGKEIAKEGGVASIVNALRRHPHHAELQQHGCGALENLARNDAAGAIMADIAEQGGIGAIIEALRNHPDHVDVQWNGCKALVNLAFADANRVEISKQGGIGAIIEVDTYNDRARGKEGHTHTHTRTHSTRSQGMGKD